MVLTLSAILWNIVMLSMVYVAVERFCALQKEKSNEGGMKKHTVILLLAASWFVVVLAQTIPIGVEPIFHGDEPFIYFDIKPGHQACYVIQMVIPTILRIIVFILAFVAIVTVIIGIAVLGCRNTVTPEVKQSVVIPTLTFSTLFLLFTISGECTNVLAILNIIPYNQLSDHIFNFLLLLTWISFPVTWLVTWSRSGDISWKRKELFSCCYGNIEEKRHLLEPK
jgi:hypothetical protein